MIVGEEEKPSLDELAHFGVKGMHWGVRKDQQTGPYRLQGATLEIDPSLPQPTKVAVKEVSSLMSKRYGLEITSIKTIKPGNPEYSPGKFGTYAYVERTPGQKGNTIYLNSRDVRKEMQLGETRGWFGPDTGNLQALITHESAHAVFHAEQKLKNGFFGPKLVGGDIKARDKALSAAVKEAKREGISPQMFSSKVSGYAFTSGRREEVEAEMFSQYHWSKNPPLFVKVWGETLHNELGIDGTPFREEVNRG